MKTIKEVADQLGISKQRVYRYYIKNCISDAHQTTSPIQLSDAVVSEILQHFAEKTASSDVHHDVHQTTSSDTVSDAVYDAILRQLEEKKLPQNTDYSEVYGLRLEAAEKLNKILKTL